MPQDKLAASPVFVAVDFETAGYYAHSACAIGLARLENMSIVDQYYSLIKPPSSRVYFTHIHGLTWKELKNARTFEQIWPEVSRFMDGADYLVAHNAPFDNGVLCACSIAFGFTLPPIPFLCTLKGARKALKIPSKNLKSVCDYFGIDLTHHHAASDARGCALILASLLKLGLAVEDMLVKEAS